MVALSAPGEKLVSQRCQDVSRSFLVSSHGSDHFEMDSAQFQQLWLRNVHALRHNYFMLNTQMVEVPSGQQMGPKLRPYIWTLQWPQLALKTSDGQA